MDMLDPALDESQDKSQGSPTSEDNVHLTEDGTDEQGNSITTVGGQGALSLDPTVQYQFRAETGQGGQVTYRVVQVTQDGGEATCTAQVVSTTGFPAAPMAQVVQAPDSHSMQIMGTTENLVAAQAVLPGTFNGGSPTSDSTGEARFTYFPTAAVGGGDTVTTQPADVANAASALNQVSATSMVNNGGQLYVMMSPQDVLQAGQRTIAPRTSFEQKSVNRSTRDDRRRATHNEVERRRRDKINNWIVQLSKLLPDSAQELSKNGQVSKGGILSKACDHITELRTANARMAESLKESERCSVDLEILRQQCEELKAENTLLRSQLQQSGVVITSMEGSSS